LEEDLPSADGQPPAFSLKPPDRAALMDLLPTPWHWLAAVACGLIVGAAKTGIPGLGFLAVPWFAWIFHDQVKLSAGALLPLLIAADMMAVWLYRANIAVNLLWHMLPWVVIGMGAGAVALHCADNAMLRPVIGGFIVGMIALHLWRKSRKSAEPPGRQASIGYGMTAGLTTTVANAAGPVMNLYLLGQRLPKEAFIAAGAWFFFAVNLTKVPIYALNGMITRETLMIDACLVPAVVVGSLLGRRIVKHIPQVTFEAVVLALALLGGAMLLIPAR
jgi:uncharacterized membrane protein YfcA